MNTISLRPVRWAYGVTTVPERFNTTLPLTLASLAKSGFDSPQLFVDGANEKDIPSSLRGMELTCHYPRVRTYGNWLLALMELFLRHPESNRYAIFQDDFLTCVGLKEYLSRCEYKTKTYQNLYTFPENESLRPPGYEGWYPSNQRGRGAVALVFDRDAATEVLHNKHIITRSLDPRVGHRNVDGGVVTGLSHVGYTEIVHYPSLVQHIGKESVMGSRPHKLSNSFRGTDWDARTLLRQPATAPTS